VTAMLLNVVCLVLILCCLIVSSSCMGKMSNAVMALLVNCSTVKLSFSRPMLLFLVCVCVYVILCVFVFLLYFFVFFLFLFIARQHTDARY